MPFHFFVDFHTHLISGNFHIITHLQIKPKFRLYAKLHRGHLLKFEGKSFRLKEASKRLALNKKKH